MNNNWRGNGEAVFTFSGLAAGRTDSVLHPASVSWLLKGEGRGKGGMTGQPRVHRRSLHTVWSSVLALNPNPEGSWAALDSAGTLLDVRPDVQAPAACLWTRSCWAADLTLLLVMTSVWSTCRVTWGKVKWKEETYILYMFIKLIKYFVRLSCCLFWKRDLTTNQLNLILKIINNFAQNTN